MLKRNIGAGCMMIFALTLIIASWHAPVNQIMSANLGDIHAQGNGYMTSTSTLVDYMYIESGRGAKGYFTLAGNSCDIEMDVYIYSSEAYCRYSAGQNVTPYRTFCSYPSRRWTLVAPSSDYWYVVYRPATSFSGSIYVSTVYQVDNSGPVISTNLQNILSVNSSFTIQANATDLFQVSYIGIEINGNVMDEVLNSSTISYKWTPDPNFQQINTVTITSWDQFDQVSSSTFYIIGADRTPPVVTWNSHPTTVSGSSVYLYISYSDNVALKRFSVLMNGSQLYNIVYSSSPPYYGSVSTCIYWNTLTVANGPVTLAATAWDEKGLNTSSSISVKIDNDHTNPSAEWQSVPSEVQGYAEFQVKVSDNEAISWVAFYASSFLDSQGALLERIYNPSNNSILQFTIDTTVYSNGWLYLQAVVCDTSGNQVTSTNQVDVNNGGSSTIGTSSPDTTPIGVIVILCVVGMLSLTGILAGTVKKKNAISPTASAARNNRLATSSNTSSHPSTASSSNRPAIPVRSSVNHSPSTASSRNRNTNPVLPSITSHPSTTSSTTSRPSARSGTGRPNLPASCFIPSTQWDVVEGIRMRSTVPSATQNASPAEDNTNDVVTPWVNHAIAPKTSRMYVDGAFYNDVASRDDASGSIIQASMPMLFCKECNAPFVPDQKNSQNPATCKNCGAVLMQLVPIVSITRAKFIHADADYRTFVDVLSWLLAKQAMPADGSLNKARLRIILNHTGHADVDSRHFIDKMLRTRLIMAETERTVILARTIVECTSLDSLMVYLSEYLRNM